MKPRPSEMLPAVANIYSTFPCEVNDLKVTSLNLQISNVLIDLPNKCASVWSLETSCLP